MQSADEFGAFDHDDDAFIALAMAVEEQMGGLQASSSSPTSQNKAVDSQLPRHTERWSPATSPSSSVAPPFFSSSQICSAQSRLTGTRPWRGDETDTDNSAGGYYRYSSVGAGERSEAPVLSRASTNQADIRRGADPMGEADAMGGADIMDDDADSMDEALNGNEWAQMMLTAMARALVQRPDDGQYPITTARTPFPYEAPEEAPEAPTRVERRPDTLSSAGRRPARNPPRQRASKLPRRNLDRNLWSDPDIPWHPSHTNAAGPPSPEPKVEKREDPEVYIASCQTPTPQKPPQVPPQITPFQILPQATPSEITPSEITPPEIPPPTLSQIPTQISPPQIPPTASMLAGAEAAPLPQDPPLCPEQAALVDLIASGRNVFYTGAAGCGKSTVLRAAVRKLVELNKRVHVVAPTGLAARNVNGVTTWSYAGMTPALVSLPLETLLQRSRAKKIRIRFENTDVLIIDEISMVDSFQLDRLDAVMRAGRGTFTPRNQHLPFGGVQVVFVGDFCQLPPVKPFESCIYCGVPLRANIEETEFTCVRKPGTHKWLDEEKWAFKSASWANASLGHVYLDTIHRQKEAVFVNMLNKLRVGEFLTHEEVVTLQNNQPKIRDSAVRLYSTRDEVRRENATKFAALPTEPHEFTNMDSVHWLRGSEYASEWLHSKTARDFEGNLVALKDHRFERRIQYKRGMLVALMVNLDVSIGLCNGAQGRVTGWKPFHPAGIASFSLDNKDSAPPLKSENPDPHEDADIREQEVRRYCQRFDQTAPEVIPEVYFFPHNGNPGFTRLIYPSCVTNLWTEPGPDNTRHEVLICRTQIPLVPAWAMTIHKSQGMTLSRVIVDLAREFEEGQAYVALSRATGLEGLIVERAEALREPRRRANSVVKRFYGDVFGKGR